MVLDNVLVKRGKVMAVCVLEHMRLTYGKEYKILEQTIYSNAVCIKNDFGAREWFAKFYFDWAIPHRNELIDNILS